MSVPGPVQAGAVYQPCVLTAPGEYISLMKRPGGHGRGCKSARGAVSPDAVAGVMKGSPPGATRVR